MVAIKRPDFQSSGPPSDTRLLFQQCDLSGLNEVTCLRKVRNGVAVSFADHFLALNHIPKEMVLRPKSLDTMELSWARLQNSD